MTFCILFSFTDKFVYVLLHNPTGKKTCTFMSVKFLTATAAGNIFFSQCPVRQKPCSERPRSFGLKLQIHPPKTPGAMLEKSKRGFECAKGYVNLPAKSMESPRDSGRICTCPKTSRPPVETSLNLGEVLTHVSLNEKTQ